MITRISDCPDTDDALFELAGCRPDESVFFDIETTGFRPDTSHVYLIGVSYPSSEGRKCIQWISDRITQEASLLRLFGAFVRPFRNLLHFNGEHFDIPYLISKYDQYGIDAPFEQLHSLDLYQTVKGLRTFLSLKQMNQKSLERFTGLNREDPYSGGDLIQVYRNYLRTADSELLETLLLHNLEDLTGMIHVMKLLSYLPIWQSTAEGPSLAWEFREDRSNQQLEISAELPAQVPVPVALDVTAGASILKLRMEHCHVCLTVSLPEMELRHYFPNYRDYYYLPVEDQAIHKSVSVYVDPAFRKQACAKNCYIRKTGRFLPQKDDLFTPVFRMSNKDRISYVPYDPNLLKEERFRKQYPAILLSFFR